MIGLAAELRGARDWMKVATATLVCGTNPYTCSKSNTMYGDQHSTNTGGMQGRRQWKRVRDEEYTPIKGQTKPSRTLASGCKYRYTYNENPALFLAWESEVRGENDVMELPCARQPTLYSTSESWKNRDLSQKAVLLGSVCVCVIVIRCL